jgi:hypothetical protein
LVFALSIVGAGIACYFLSRRISRDDHPR